MLSYTSPAEELRAHQALRFYRYLSWALTSLLYLLSIPRHNFGFALGVATALLLAGHFASNFYQSVGLTRRLAVSLILTETVGIALLLIPTGGLNSPFIWYALNPIFMAALMLPVAYCWLVLSGFLGSATVGSVMLFGEPLADVWSGRSWFIIVFLMVTAAASVFSYLVIGLRKAYAQLHQAHQEAERLLVVEEQNRIANEIHDGVSQHLFSIVYALHSLTRRQGYIQEQDAQEQLQLIAETATQAAQELRASIYRIKPGQNASQAFISTLAAHLSDLEKLNGIKVSLEATGSEDAISPALRQAFFRIVKEAAANAIRHGSCRAICIGLDMQPGAVQLKIVDDGLGFESGQVHKKGLGLNNMAGLMANFGGSLQIDSSPGQGTCVTCTIPAAGK